MLWVLARVVALIIKVNPIHIQPLSKGRTIVIFSRSAVGCTFERGPDAHCFSHKLPLLRHLWACFRLLASYSWKA